MSEVEQDQEPGLEQTGRGRGRNGSEKIITARIEHKED